MNPMNLSRVGKAILKSLTVETKVPRVYGKAPPKLDRTLRPEGALIQVQSK
jgi:hypothetical protein